MKNFISESEVFPQQSEFSIMLWAWFWLKTIPCEWKRLILMELRKKRDKKSIFLINWAFHGTNNLSNSTFRQVSTQKSFQFRGFPQIGFP